MNSLQIEIFLEIADCKNFSKVAREKYITQPTVSKHIQNLERELNVKLFNRKKPNIDLTPEGIIYQQAFLQCRDILRKAQQDTSKFINNSICLKIGLLSGWHISYDLMNAIDFVIDNHIPKLDIIVENHSFNKLINSLNDGTIDACIHLHDFLKNENSVTSLPLIEIPKYLIYSSKLTEDLPKDFSFSNFADYVFFAIGENNNTMVKSQLIEYCSPYDISPKISILPNIESVLANVSRGKGVSIVDSYTGTQNYDNIQKMEIFPRHKIEIAWKKDNNSLYLTSFAEMLSTYLNLFTTSSQT